MAPPKFGGYGLTGFPRVFGCFHARKKQGKSQEGKSKENPQKQVPLFWFLFRGSMRTYPRSGFRSPGNIRMYPPSVVHSGGTSTKTTLLETHPFVNPEKPSFRYFPRTFFTDRKVSNFSFCPFANSYLPITYFFRMN